MKKCKYYLLVMLFLVSSCESGEAQAQDATGHTGTLSKTSVMMVECEAVYLWAAQLWARDGIKDEAKKLLKRGALVTASNFMLNETEGVVPGATLSLFKPITRKTKKRLDEAPNISFVRSELDHCRQSTKGVIDRLEESKKLLWGMSLAELSESLYLKGLASLKLN